MKQKALLFSFFILFTTGIFAQSIDSVIAKNFGFLTKEYTGTITLLDVTNETITLDIVSSLGNVYDVNIEDNSITANLTVEGADQVTLYLSVDNEIVDSNEWSVVVYANHYPFHPMFQNEMISLSSYDIESRIWLSVYAIPMADWVVATNSTFTYEYEYSPNTDFIQLNETNYIEMRVETGFTGNPAGSIIAILDGEEWGATETISLLPNMQTLEFTQPTENLTYGIGSTLNVELISSSAVTVQIKNGVNEVVAEADYMYLGIMSFDFVIEESWLVLNNALTIVCTSDEGNEIGYDVDVDTTSNSNDVVTVVANLGVYPNPFNPSTTVSYLLKENSEVDLAVYNLKGQLVKILQQEQVNAGQHRVLWNGIDSYNKEVSSGTYIFRMRVNNKIYTSKAILMK